VVNGRSPVVCVALGDRRFDSTNTDARQFRGELDVHVYMVSSHARGLLERTRGGDAPATASNSADPGLEVVGEHVFERLAGFVLRDHRAAELRPEREEFAFVGDAFTVVEQRYSTQVTTNVNPRRSYTTTATEIDTTHTDTEAGDPSAVRHVTELVP
jgi:hypothetical protein